MELLKIDPTEKFSAAGAPEVKAVAVDWMELTFMQPGSRQGVTFKPHHELPENETVRIGDFDFVHTSVKTRIYSKMHKVYYQGQEVANLFSIPHQNLFVQPYEVRIKIANALLYQEWYPILRKLCKAMDLTFSGFGRIDIACDGYNFSEPIRQMLTGNCYKVGRADWQPTFCGSGRDVKQWRIGSRSSDRHVTGYNKYKEIDQHSKKYYIFEHWKANGMEPTEDVERLEVRMRGKTVKSLWDPGATLSIESIQAFCNVDFLCSVVKTMLHHLYDFRDDSDENVKRCNRIFKVVWNYSAQVLERAKQVSASHIRGVQTTIKKLYQLHVASGLEHYNKLVDEICVNTGLLMWMEKRRARWQYEVKLNRRKGVPFFGMYRTYRAGEQVTMYPINS